MQKALFGPGGNSLSFYASGMKSTLQAPGWLSSLGLGAYEYQAARASSVPMIPFCHSEKKPRSTA